MHRLHADIALLFAAALVLYLVLRHVTGRLTERHTQRSEPPPPSFFERALSAVPPVAASNRCAYATDCGTPQLQARRQARRIGLLVLSPTTAEDALSHPLLRR